MVSQNRLSSMDAAALCAAFSIAAMAGIAHAAIVNGSFDHPDGAGGTVWDWSWTHNQGVYEHSDYPQAAFLAQLSRQPDQEYAPILVDGSLLPESQLSQVFDFTDMTGALSFRFLPGAIDPGEIHETDHFFVSLLDSSGIDPIVAYSGQPWFYHWDSNPATPDDAAPGVSITALADGWFDVALAIDPAWHTGNDYLQLRFSLLHEWEDDPIHTFVVVDDVRTVPVPAPSALILMLTGLGAMQMTGRRSQGR